MEGVPKPWVNEAGLPCSKLLAQVVAPAAGPGNPAGVLAAGA